MLEYLYIQSVHVNMRCFVKDRSQVMLSISILLTCLSVAPILLTPASHSHAGNVNCMLLDCGTAHIHRCWWLQALSHHSPRVINDHQFCNCLIMPCRTLSNPIRLSVFCIATAVQENGTPVHVLSVLSFRTWHQIHHGCLSRDYDHMTSSVTWPASLELSCCCSRTSALLNGWLCKLCVHIKLQYVYWYLKHIKCVQKEHLKVSSHNSSLQKCGWVGSCPQMPDAYFTGRQCFFLSNCMTLNHMYMTSYGVILKCLYYFHPSLNGWSMCDNAAELAQTSYQEIDQWAFWPALLWSLIPTGEILAVSSSCFYFVFHQPKCSTQLSRPAILSKTKYQTNCSQILTMIRHWNSCTISYFTKYTSL